jgi:hypothetical protein
MANIWCCTASVKLDRPIKTPGYPPSAMEIPVDVKVRTEGDKEPSDKAIAKAAVNKIEACYGIKVLKTINTHVNFLLWEL